MPVPKRHLRPMRRRLGPGEEIVVAVQGTLGRTGAMIVGFLLGAAVSVPLAMLAQSMAGGRYTYIAIGPPLAGVGLATRRRPLSAGSPPFAIPIQNVFVLTTHELHVWQAGGAFTPEAGRSQRGLLGKLAGSVYREAIASVGEADGMLEVRLHSGHTLRTKVKGRDLRRFVEGFSSAGAPAVSR